MLRVEGRVIVTGEKCLIDRNERGMIFMHSIFSRFSFASFFGKEIYFVIFSVVTLTCKKIGDISCQILLNFTSSSNIVYFLSPFLHFVPWNGCRKERKKVTELDMPWTCLVTYKEKKWEWNTCQVWCSQLYLQNLPSLFSFLSSLPPPLTQSSHLVSLDSLACRVTNDRTFK